MRPKALLHGLAWSAVFAVARTAGKAAVVGAYTWIRVSDAAYRFRHWRTRQ